MKVRLFASQLFVPRMSASTKSLLAVGLAVLIALSSSLANASPAVATHTALSLPSDPVVMEVFNGSQSYFDINISNVPAGYDITNGRYPAWCVDRTAEMQRSPAIHQVRLYSSFSPPGELATQKWDMVNYVLNHKQGSAQDIQEAIWYFVNFGLGYSPTSLAALTLVHDALANGNGFVPRPGQIIAIICSPVVVLPSTADVQVTVIEITVPTLIGDVTGPDGQPDGLVNMRDVGLVARNFGQTVPPAPANCDLTGPTAGVPDGKIDMRDIGIVARHFGDSSL